jgi:copper(I)-binding protein
MTNRTLIALVAMLVAVPAIACDLKVESAWIREAHGSATALAGFARLSNVGKKPLKFKRVTASNFGAIETHESITENGIAKMRPISIQIPVGGVVEFAPGGKHFMLLRPKAVPNKGDVVTLKIKDATGCVTKAAFVVGSAPPVAESAAMKHE